MSEHRMQLASFLLWTAIEHGFFFRTIDGELEVAIPRRMPRESREPLVAELFEHRSEIIHLIDFIEAEEQRGIAWRQPETRALQ